MTGWMQTRAFARTLKREQETRFQAVRTRREAEDILRSAMQMSSIKNAEIVELPNGQFQVVAQESRKHEARLAVGDRVRVTPGFAGGELARLTGQTGVVVGLGGTNATVRLDDPNLLQAVVPVQALTILESRVRSEAVDLGRPPFALPFSIDGHEERGEASVTIEDANGKTVWHITSPDLEEEIENGFIDLTGRGRPAGAFASMIDTLKMRGALDRETAEEALLEGPSRAQFTGGLRNAAA